MQGKGGSGWEAATFQGKQGPLKIRHVDSQFFYIFPRAASTTTRSSVHLLPPPFTRKEFFIDLQTFVRLPHMRKFYIYFCFILLQKTVEAEIGQQSPFIFQWLSHKKMVRSIRTKSLTVP